MWRLRPTPPGASLPAGGVRWACAVALTLLTVPAMLLAHLIIARQVPSAAAVLVISVVVVGVAGVLPSRSRAGLAAVAALAQALGQTLLALLSTGPTSTHAGGCLPAIGRGAEVGLRLALLRHDTACPPGTLAPGPAAAVATAALLTAVLILAGHSAVALLTGWLVLGTVATVEVAQRLRAVTMVAVLLRPRPTVPAPRALLATPPPRPVPAAGWVPPPLSRRGPPLPAGR